MFGLLSLILPAAVAADYDRIESVADEAWNLHLYHKAPVLIGAVGWVAEESWEGLQWGVETLPFHSYRLPVDGDNAANMSPMTTGPIAPPA